MTRKGDFKPLKDRLEGFVDPCPATGCWLFAGKLDKDGYGSMHNRSGGGDYKAHRVAWQEFVGPIPPGLDVAHHCDVRCCVNPSHLYVATRRQNLADRTKRKREPRGEACSWSKLKSEDAIYIMNSTEKIEALVERFGISRAQVYRVKSGECWGHLEGGK